MFRTGSAWGVDDGDSAERASCSVLPNNNQSPRAGRLPLAGLACARLLSAVNTASSGVVAALRARALPRRTSVGDELLVATVRAGEDVVLATGGGSDLYNHVSAYAERLRERATAASVIVTRIDARPATTSHSRQVRLFGRPFGMSDATALVAATLGAPIFPTFALPGLAGHHRIHVNEPCRVLDTSDVALHRVAQRLAWQLERFAMSVPSYELALREEVGRAAFDTR